MSVQRIRIDEINVTNRHRKELGDIKAFASRMKERGMLQPIVVKKVNGGYKLLAGERRFRARRAMGESMIEAKVVEAKTRLEELLVERDENDDREEMKPSEKVALANEIKELIGSRQGQHQSTLPQIIGEVEKGKETAEIAAEEAGFGNVETYRQAAIVVEQGVPELIEAMDAGEVSIADAAKAAKKPKRKQKRGVKAVKDGEAKTVTGAISKFDEADAEEDEAEPTIDDEIKKHNSAIDSFCRDLMKLTAAIPNDVWLDDMDRRGAALQKFKDGCSTLRSAKCQPCPKCHGEGCASCKKTGRVPKLVYDQLA